MRIRSDPWFLQRTSNNQGSGSQPQEVPNPGRSIFVEVRGINLQATNTARSEEGEPQPESSRQALAKTSGRGQSAHRACDEKADLGHPLSS